MKVAVDKFTKNNLLINGCKVGEPFHIFYVII